jgi:hypothetical protein
MGRRWLRRWRLWRPRRASWPRSTWRMVDYHWDPAFKVCFRRFPKGATYHSVFTAIPISSEVGSNCTTTGQPWKPFGALSFLPSPIKHVRFLQDAPDMLLTFSKELAWYSQVHVAWLGEASCRLQYTSLQVSWSIVRHCLGCKVL